MVLYAVKYTYSIKATRTDPVAFVNIITTQDFEPFFRFSTLRC